MAMRTGSWVTSRTSSTAFTPEACGMNIRTFYRALRPAWSFAPLSGAGAAHNGGRWNAKGSPALYLAGDPMTALAEYNQDLLFRPVTLARYRVSGAILADVCDPAFCWTHEIDHAAMACDWFALSLTGRTVPSWEIAARLVSDGFHGLLFPSRINGAPCAVLWLWNESGGCKVTVDDAENRLPGDASSWQR